MRSLAAAAARSARRGRRAFSQQQLPDYNTDVNVADIRLSKPQRAKADTDKRRNAATWDGLDDLAKVRV